MKPRLSFSGTLGCVRAVIVQGVVDRFGEDLVDEGVDVVGGCYREACVPE